MCGICGAYVRGEADDRQTRRQREALALVVTDLLLANESRGHHATGLALVEWTGQVRWAKAAARAEAFVQTREFAGLIGRIKRPRGPRPSHQYRPRSILGHTRWATVGSPGRMENNHPIIAGTIVGTHNGHIDNADAVFHRLPLSRTAQVDSEVLFRLAEATDSPRAWAKKVGICKGSMAVAYVDRLHSSHLVLARRSQELSVVEVPSLNAVVWSSEMAALEWALDGIPFTPAPVPEYTARYYTPGGQDHDYPLS